MKPPPFQTRASSFARHLPPPKMVEQGTSGEILPRIITSNDPQLSSTHSTVLGGAPRLLDRIVRREQRHPPMTPEMFLALAEQRPPVFLIGAESLKYCDMCGARNLRRSVICGSFTLDPHKYRGPIIQPRVSNHSYWWNRGFVRKLVATPSYSEHTGWYHVLLSICCPDQTCLMNYWRVPPQRSGMRKYGFIRSITELWLHPLLFPDRIIFIRPYQDPDHAHWVLGTR